MGKQLYIAEKPSVAREFAKALGYRMQNKDGYMECEEALVTWCVGHLVTMSYPEKYDEKYRRWSLQTLPFIPETFQYEVIEGVKKQFDIVSSLLNRKDVDVIYVCTDSGREGEYIYRLVEMQAGVLGKQRKRVWIDSQTEEEIRRGIREAKDLSAYDNLGEAAYLRAKEDYLMGINFSRVLTLKYGDAIKNYLKADRAVISVGRVMTCVLGMVVNREREIRNFVKTPFYRVTGTFILAQKEVEAEWRSVRESRYYQSPLLYKENGFLEKKEAEALVSMLTPGLDRVVLESLEQKKEKKNPPLLYNLAELQNDCAKYFKISPDETLRIVQELYEKKLTTYPRTDARVLSTAVTKEITKNLKGLTRDGTLGAFAEEVLEKGMYRGLAKSRYVDDKKITDHYAIIPTGQGQGALQSLRPATAQVYELICRRFLSIFYPAAVYEKAALTVLTEGERLFANFRALAQAGYLKVFQAAFMRKKESGEKEEESGYDMDFLQALHRLKPKDKMEGKGYQVKEGETGPPKRYNSGSMILAMENAGQLIEDEELRAQIKGSGIGTSATRAEILKKLVHIKYLSLNKKNQMISPTLLGEMVYDVVNASIRPLLNPALTASWEKGLTLVAHGSITGEEYMEKLDSFVTRRTNTVKTLANQSLLYRQFDEASKNYKATRKKGEQIK